MIVRRTSLLVLLLVCVAATLATNFNGDYDESQSDNFPRVIFFLLLFERKLDSLDSKNKVLCMIV